MEDVPTKPRAGRREQRARISWGRGARHLLVALIASFLTIAGLAGASPSAGAASSRQVRVIVRTTAGGGAAAKRALTRAGGTFRLRLKVLHGFSATLPASHLGDFETARGVASVTIDATLAPQSVNGYDASTDGNSMNSITRRITGASDFWSNGYTGKGVDVALIDTGVAPVNGLTAPGKVINGPDLSFESQNSSLRYLDTNGHGTFMASLIAGRDDGVTSVTGAGPDQFLGMAPDARIVSVKVADAFGSTDVSQVIAGIGWVVEHRNDHGMNIRVLNLSYGTDGVQSYQLDPLAYAAEVAWRKGIVVVASAGNSGYGSDTLNDPALDPYVIAVGAADTNGTATKNDDSVPTWSSSGDGIRNPDFVAPGRSIVGLRDPGSQIDQAYPGAVVGGRFFRGSGTSQAAAIVSGAAALMVQRTPGITPDQVKATFTRSTQNIASYKAIAQGAGEVNLKTAYGIGPQSSTQTFPASRGTGSLELSRGTAHLSSNSVFLTGEKDIFGAAWNSSSQAVLENAQATWNGGIYNGNGWAGNVWTTNGSWTKNEWASCTWQHGAWSGASWTSNAWDRNSWSRNSWSGGQWTRNSWSSDTFARNSWSSVSWG
ncbi:MAG TPA: S8 family serine peptidase [Actinomycetota bacterium]